MKKVTQTGGIISVRNELYLRTLRRLAELHKCPGGVLWLRRDDHFAAVVPCRMMLPEDCVEPADSVFCLKLGEEWVYELETRQAMETKVPALPAWVHLVPELGLVLPLLVKDELIGFIGLQRSLGYDRLSAEHADRLKRAARQAAERLAGIGSFPSRTVSCRDAEPATARRQAPHPHRPTPEC